MKFSFVIPTYNKPHVLRRTLEALNHQEGFGADDYEVIVVDDGSEQVVLEAVRGVNRNYPLHYIYLHRSEDSCRGRSRNYGIAAARGRFINFIDDDIITAPNHLLELERYYKQSENMLIIGTRFDCSFELVQREGIERIRELGFKNSSQVLYDNRLMPLNHLSFNLAAHKFPWMLAYTCNLSVPKQLLEDIGGFDENFKKWGYEDTEMACRLFRRGVRFLINPRLEAVHQSHPRGPAGENNHDYFMEKCGDSFEKIHPAIIFSILSGFPNNHLRKLRQYCGKITAKKILNFKTPSSLEKVKEKIQLYALNKGTQVMVVDYVNSTDLDLWIQMQDFKDALVTYYPASMQLSQEQMIARTLVNSDDGVEADNAK